MNLPVNNHSNPIDFICSITPFDRLTEAECERVEQTVESSQFALGTHILEQDGTPSKYLYIICSGTVRFVKDGQVVRVLEEGELFGYPSMLNQNPPAFDVIAEEDVLAYLIPQITFFELVDNAVFAGFFLRSLSERLRRYSRVEAPSSVSGNLTTPVGNLVVRTPLMVNPVATVAEVAQAISRAWADSALVLGNPPGIVTDRDFRVRVLAEGLSTNTPIHQIMTRPLKTLPSDTPVYAALLYMLEENIHHLALTKDGEIIGVVTSNDLLRYQAKSPLYLLRQLETLETSEGLARYSLEVAGTVETLFKGGLDVGQIGRVIASLNDALIRRLLKWAEEDLGPPPTPYTWIVFGSEGRMEQALLTDQDNALIYQDDTPEAKEYFCALAERVVGELIYAGFPPCPGGYMAKNWYRPLNEWVQLFNKWIMTPEPQALLETAIFFDFRSVYGELSVEPLEAIVQKAGEQQVFLGHLANASLSMRPPLGFFRRIKGEDGMVDLKEGGIAPIVSLTRVYALAAKTRARSTLERLEAAAEARTVSQDGAETLIEMYSFLLRLRLREQLAALAAGETPGNKVQLESLSPVEYRHLKDAFLAIREMQEAISKRFHTDLLG